MKKIITAASFTVLSLMAYGQGSGLKSLVDEFSSSLKEVNTSKDKYTQTVEYPEPAVVAYKKVETDSKGKTSSQTFTFNLADIDPYTVKTETSRDVIYVNFSIVNKQKLIATTEDGEKENYENELRFIAADVDNGRHLVETLKKTIPLAKELMKQRLALNSYRAQIDWLKMNVKDVKSGDKAYNQSFVLSDFPGSITFSQTEVGSRGSEVHKYSFNLADIDPATVNFNISGNELSIKLETARDQKVIQHQEDGEAKPFTKEVDIYTNSVEAARDLRTALLLAIPEAKAMVEKDLPSYKSSSEALADVKKYLSEVKYDDDLISQTLEGNCQANLIRIEKDPKDTKTLSYKFNFMDINKEALNYDVSGDKMFIEPITTNKIKLIQEHEDGELKGYEYKFRLYAKDVELARRLLHALRYASEWCGKEYKDPFSSSSQDIFNWLQANVKDIEKNGSGYKQKLEEVDNGHNKLKYTKTEWDDKNTVEEIFEFNLSDLKPESVEFEVGGDDLAVHVESNYQEKIIKYYKDGEIQNYKNSFNIKFENIETARGVKNALKQLIKTAEK